MGERNPQRKTLNTFLLATADVGQRTLSQQRQLGNGWFAAQARLRRPSPTQTHIPLFTDRELPTLPCCELSLAACICMHAGGSAADESAMSPIHDPRCVRAHALPIHSAGKGGECGSPVAGQGRAPHDKMVIATW